MKHTATCIAVVCATIGLIAVNPISSLAQDSIDFELLADSTATTEEMLISDQYRVPPDSATYIGVTFSMSNGRLPKIAKTGAPRVAFSGISTTDPQCGINTATLHDMPAAKHQDRVGCTFLARDTLSGTPANLIVDLEETAFYAWGDLLDVDGTEEWKITAKLGGAIVTSRTASPKCGGCAQRFDIDAPGGFDQLVFEYTGSGGPNPGWALDNFGVSNDEPPPPPPPDYDAPMLDWRGTALLIVLLLVLAVLAINRRIRRAGPLT